jgi:hypothetical protein
MQIAPIPSPVPSVQPRPTPPLHPGNGVGALGGGGEVVNSSAESENLKKKLQSALDEVMALHRST